MASWVYVFGERYFSDSLIKTTSLSSVPRAKASGFPSREMAKEKICAGVNSASNFGGRFYYENPVSGLSRVHHRLDYHFQPHPFQSADEPPLEMLRALPVEVIAA